MSNHQSGWNHRNYPADHRSIYKVECPTCGQLGGRFGTSADAKQVADAHQEAHANAQRAWQQNAPTR